MKFFRSINEIDRSKYIVVTYRLAGATNLRDAAWEIAIGQSVGNPKVRNQWETEELFENHSCIILDDENELLSKKSGIVSIAFPVININWEDDGITHLLCQIMGGQLDIDNITQCHVTDISIPSCIPQMPGKYGMRGIREYTGVKNKPLLGGIVKPKIGVSPQVLLEMVKEMVDNGVNFIKEDEIMANPAICPLEERIPPIVDYIAGKKVIYAACINADPANAMKKAILVHRMGGNAVHLNMWAGLGTYRSIRELDLPLFMHFQKSGDKIFTDNNHRFHISFYVLAKLTAYLGIDFIHAGMIGGGYSSTENSEMMRILDRLRYNDIMPALSCGMNPVIVNDVTKQAGNDYMANVGGALHGHPQGTGAGVRAMRQAIDGTFGPEYDAAVQKWGLAK